MRVPGATPCRAPSRPPKYEPTYALATVLKKPRSIAYLTSRERHLAVHGRREAHAVADLHGDGAAVGRDDRGPRGEVRGGAVRRARPVAREPALGDVGDDVAGRVVRPARVDRVDVALVQDAQRPALLRRLRRRRGVTRPAGGGRDGRDSHDAQHAERPARAHPTTIRHRRPPLLGRSETLGGLGPSPVRRRMIRRTAGAECASGHARSRGDGAPQWRPRNGPPPRACRPPRGPTRRPARRARRAAPPGGRGGSPPPRRRCRPARTGGSARPMGSSA